jgi:cytochrome P450
MRADFVSQAYFRNPAAEIEKLRSAGPVVEVQFPMIGKIWTTTTQELAARVLKDSKTFTIRSSAGGVAGLQWWMPRILGTLANHMLSKDEPDHRRLRDIVDEAFRRRAVLEMEPRILAPSGVTALVIRRWHTTAKKNLSASRTPRRRAGASRRIVAPPGFRRLGSAALAGGAAARTRG